MNQRIRLLRKSLKLTQSNFARKIGIGATAISKLEKGENTPSDQTILSICREFNVNEQWLRTGEGEMFDTSSTFSLDEYAKQRNMSNLEKDIIKCYLELPNDTRTQVLNHFSNYFRDKKNKKNMDHSDMFTPIAAHTEDTSEENIKLMMEDLEDE